MVQCAVKTGSIPHGEELFRVCARLAGVRRRQVERPAGQAHDLWANVNTVPRLLQAAPNSDFEVVAKFNNGVSQTWLRRCFCA